MKANTLREALQNWLSAFDFGVMSLGFAPHGRDYIWIVEAPSGRYEVTLTHVVELHYETCVLGYATPGTWDDRLTDYATAYVPGAPEGHVWGTNWSLAYPGLEAPDDDCEAKKWSDCTGKPMYAMSVRQIASKYPSSSTHVEVGSSRKMHRRCRRCLSLCPGSFSSPKT
jgi:hypothetical protein